MLSHTNYVLLTYIVNKFMRIIVQSGRFEEESRLKGNEHEDYIKPELQRLINADLSRQSFPHTLSHIFIRSVTHAAWTPSRWTCYIYQIAGITSPITFNLIIISLFSLIFCYSLSFRIIQ